MNTWLHEPRQDAPCTIVAEVAQAHDGSLGMAHAFIDAAADCGVDAIKFQTHIAAAESTPHEPWRKPFSSQDATRMDYWRRMEFTPPQWLELKTHATERGLLFLSSPFSVAAIELLEDVGVAGWKIASGETENPPMLQRMLDSGRPMIVSTGMSSLSEIDRCVKQITAAGSPLALLQCTSAYPCPPEAVGLNVIEEFQQRYDCAVGLSDHSATIFPGLAAATLGIALVEVHLTLSRQMFGPDVVASLTPAQMSELVQGVRFIETMRRHPVDKSSLSEDALAMRRIFNKSVVAERDLTAGTVLCDADLALKKPGFGIPAKELAAVVGRRLNRDVARDELLKTDDFE